MASRKSPRDSKLWGEALLQVERGWLEGPFEFLRDAVLEEQGCSPGESFRCNPSMRFGVSQRENLRAAGDLERSCTNRVAQVLTPINLPTWYHFPSAIKSIIGKRSGRPLGFAKVDHSAAYGKLPLAPYQWRLATISLRDPQSGDRGALLPNTQLSGGGAAAIEYDCPSSFVAALASGLLQRPAMGYFDDFGLSTPLPINEDALVAFTELSKIFGFEPKLSKSVKGQILRLFSYFRVAHSTSGQPLHFREALPLFRLSQCKRG